MGRAPCCSKVGLHRGPWTPREDTLLIEYIRAHGEGHWRSLPMKAGLLRCGKSCRLRWMNYLRPDIKRGNITPDEEDLIIRLHSLLGNRWSLIAGRLSGRTDNEIKNYWNTHLSKRFRNQATKKVQKSKLSTTRESKKKKKNHHHKKLQNNNNKEEEKTENKVHHPKPIRLKSFQLTRNNSFDYNTMMKGSSLGLDEGDNNNNNNKEVDDPKVLDPPWFDSDHLKDSNSRSFAFDDEARDLVSGCDIACESQIIHTKDNMLDLEKLYDEYLQLLKTEEDDQVQLDAFAESFWA